jgi:hypothetical protein
MDKLGIVVQGPSSYVNEIKESYSGYPLIFSTWVSEEKNYHFEKDVVVFNDKTKELGHTHLLKMRNDIILTNVESFIGTFKSV